MIPIRSSLKNSNLTCSERMPFQFHNMGHCHLIHFVNYYIFVTILDGVKCIRNLMPSFASIFLICTKLYLVCKTTLTQIKLPHSRGKELFPCPFFDQHGGSDYFRIRQKIQRFQHFLFHNRAFFCLIIFSH